MRDSRATASSSCAMGSTTFSKVASSGLTFATMLSYSERVFSQSFFASSTREVAVAVKRGGAWGGDRYWDGAMVELVMGL